MAQTFTDIQHTTTIKKTSVPITETPQKVFEKKKTIFRFNQIIWYVLDIVEILLLFRFSLKALGANPFNDFTNFIYSISNPFAQPFQGIFRVSVSSSFVLEWSTLIAMGVYAFIAYGLVQLVEFIRPVTPEEVEND